MSAKRKKPRSVAFNLGLVFVLLLVVSALVAFAKSRDRAAQLILPEEQAARAAKRSAPENAFPILLEAAKLLPARPNAFEEGSLDGGRRHWEERETRPLGPATLASLCLVELPDSDPQVAQYVLACAPAAAKAREALAKPYILFTQARQLRDDDYQAEIVGLARAMIALGRVQFEASPTAEALTPLTDAIQLARLLCREEALINWARVIEGKALQHIRVLGLEPARRPVLDAALTALGPGYADRQALLEVLFHHYDDQLARQGTSAGMHPGSRAFRGLVLYELQRIAIILRVKKSEALAKVGEGPLAIDSWLYQNLRDGSGSDELSSAAHKINITMRRSGELMSDFEATRIALALAAFHKDKGVYPQKLEELAPTFLPAIPADPFNGAPFGYKTSDPNSYLLYGPGYDAEDNGGDPESDRIIEQVPAPA